MEFFRENILKFILIFSGLIIVLVVFLVACSDKVVGRVKLSSYSDMENYIKDKTVTFAKNNNSVLPKENEQKIIKIKTLIDEGAMGELKAIEDSNVLCDGYVNIKNRSNNYVFRPYLKCGKYYETKIFSEYIKKNELIQNGEVDGLYNIENNYVFKGENPKNYIKIDEKYYRIMNIDNDGYIKIISVNNFNNNYVWDDRYNSEVRRSYGINDYKKSRIRASLNSYYNSDKNYSNYFKGLIVSKDICIGKRTKKDSSITNVAECSNRDQNQYISLIQVSDYAKASLSEDCKSIYDLSCSNYNYLINVSRYMITQTASSDNTYQVYLISNGRAELTNSTHRGNIYPVFYLDKDVIYSSGKGTYDEPYLIK